MSVVVELLIRVQLFSTSWTVSASVSSVHGDSPGKNAGVGCHALLQGIFLTQRWNLHPLQLLHCRRILYCWAKIYLVYMKSTLIMKIHNQWKVKMEKPKQAFVFYQLIIRKPLNFTLPSFIFKFIFSLKDNCFPEFCCFLSDFNMTLFINS